jgi:WD40 repeat protein
LKCWDLQQQINDCTNETPSRILAQGGVYNSTFIQSLTFSPNGRWMACAYKHQNLTIWDTETGLLVGDLTGDSSSLSGVGFLNNHQVVTYSDNAYINQTVQCWSLSQELALNQVSIGRGSRFVMEGHSYQVTSATYSPNGNPFCRVVGIEPFDSGMHKQGTRPYS